MNELFLITKWNLLNREVAFCALNEENATLESKLDELLALEMKHIVRKSNRWLKFLKKKYNMIYSLIQGFFMEKEEIKKRLTRKIMSCITGEKYKVIAIWVTDKDTEIFICPENPDEKTASKILSLSQSFCQN